ncbi:hypothetical protein F5876DRAFT_84651 [Lentinula aff. lateritia]|uniref:Uncharacterized protein n=1 Tax=Lentinula aff. lateritia TaxID=2804960 RepID=A0ACC1TGA2_9AGAR|nr:hypothetical protein F5876DRAFT_84651 [Lentinula aff. lateritia]
MLLYGLKVSIQTGLLPPVTFAWAFARQNHIRHMLSGGTSLNCDHIKLDKAADKKFEDITCSHHERVTQVQQYFRNGSFKPEHWVTVGQSVQEVVLWSDNIKKYLGITEKVDGQVFPVSGMAVMDKKATDQLWLSMRTGQLVPDTMFYTNTEKIGKALQHALYLQPTLFLLTVWQSLE